MILDMLGYQLVENRDHDDDLYIPYSIDESRDHDTSFYVFLKYT